MEPLYLAEEITYSACMAEQFVCVCVCVCVYIYVCVILCRIQPSVLDSTVC